MTTRLTPVPDLDDALSALHDTAATWARLDIPSKMALLVDLKRRTAQAADAWVAAAVSAKGLPDGSALAGEEWLSGPYSVLTAADAYHETLGRLWRGQTPYEPDWIEDRADGGIAVRILPTRWQDRVLLSGYTAEVWMPEGVTRGDLDQHVASFYRRTEPEGAVCLVLGAGNIASIPPLDVLHELYVKGRVALLKMNPVNDYLGPILEEVFAEYVRRGYVRIVYGGAEVGEHLTQHPRVDAVHITGSERTHDLIVFGAGDEADERKARRDPLLDKPITSELGGVSPAIVVPGPWSEADLRFQAEHFVTQKLHNGGFNCIAAQVLVVPDEWEHTDHFLALVEETIAQAPDRPAYYPGAEDRQRRAAERHPGSVTLGDGVPRTHLRQVPADSGHFCFVEEVFASVFATTRLPGRDPGDYLEAAVAFANDTLHGTLGAGLIVHPKTIAAMGRRFDRAVADLRYGCVGINVWSALGFLLPRATWGAYPGNTLDDVGSGIGVVHNALMFDRPEKTVCRGPFRPAHRAVGAGELHLSPKPLWFVTHKRADVAARELTRFAADGSLRHLPAILAAAVRG